MQASICLFGCRPGQGKTAMVANISSHVAVVEKIPVEFFFGNESGRDGGQTFSRAGRC